MKITICGSIAFYDKMQEIEQQLEEAGHEVKLPPTEVPGEDGNPIPVEEYYRRRKEADDDDAWVWDRKKGAIMNHFKKIDWADAILVTNYTKNDTENYIGGNTFLELGVAFWLGKPIYLLYPLPDVSYREEILGMKPVVLNGNVSEIQ